MFFLLKTKTKNSCSFDYTKNNAVFKWLQDLRMMSENECLCVLQAKSLMNKLFNNNNNNTQKPQIISNNNSTNISSVKNGSQNASLNSTLKLGSSIDTLTIGDRQHGDDDNVDEGDEGDDEYDENESFNDTERVQGKLYPEKKTTK